MQEIAFTHDAFLSYSCADEAVVHVLAQRLKRDGLNIWLDAWEIRPGDSIPAKIEEGLECSRVLVLFMSASAFGSDWTKLESGTFRFRDPVNKERRFIPLRLDDTPAKGSLAQFAFIDWRRGGSDAEYAKLKEACRPSNLEGASSWEGAGVISKDGSQLVIPSSSTEETGVLAENPNDAAELEEISTILKDDFTGRKRDAWEKLLAWRNGARWADSSPKVQGRILRSLTRLALQERHDVTHARRLFNEARRVEPTGAFEGLEAQLVWRESGVEDALALLSNPTIPDGWLFRAALLLQKGAASEALEITRRQGWPPRMEEDFGRISVWALLSLGCNVEAKDLASELRSKSEPTWMAMDLYGRSLVCLCITNVDVRRRYHSNPHPVPREFVRADDESRRGLELASEAFLSLLSLSGLNNAERQAVTAWRLASLAMHPGRQTEAESLALQILASERTDPAAIAWSAARNWKVDWEVIVSRLLEEAEKSNAVRDWQRLIVPLGSLHRFEEVMTILEKARFSYESEGELSEWTFLRGQTLAFIGRLQEVEATLAEQSLTTEQQGTLSRILRKLRAKTPAELKDFAAFLEEEWKKNGGGDGLWDVATAKADAGESGFIITSADQIIAEVPTPSGVQLVAEAFLRESKPDEGLAWVEKNRHLMSGGEFTPGIQRIVVYWKRQLGRLSEALEQAHIAAKKYGHWEDWHQVSQIGSMLGDQSKVLEAGKAFLGMEKMSPLVMVQTAKLLVSHSKPLAIKLAEKAAENLSPGDPGYFEAIKLTHELGISSSERKLFQKFPTGAAASPESPTWDDVRRYLHAGFHSEQNRWEAYSRGEIPIQGLPSLENSLPLIFDRAFHLNPTLSNPPPIFLYHGGRGPQNLPPKNGGLYLDLTGLLAGWHTQILEKVATHWGRLYVPQSALESIAVSVAEPGGNSRQLEAAQLICELVDRGRIQIAPVVASEMDHPHEFEIQHEWEEFIECHTHASSLIGGASAEVWHVLCALEDKGKVTREQSTLAREMFTSATKVTEDEDASRSIPQSAFNEVLDLELASLENLAEARLLEIASHEFVLRVKADDLARTRRFIKRNRWRADARNRLLELQRWIGEAQEQQKILTLPEPRWKEEEHEKEEAPEYRSLRTLLLLDAPAGSAVWLEERLFNGHGIFGKLITVTVADILDALWTRSAISSDEWITALYKLRCANVQHLPVHDKEIELHIRSAKLDEKNTLVETPEMKVLRRRVAQALRQNSQWLDKPKGGTVQEALGTAPESSWGYWIMRIGHQLASRWITHPLKTEDGSTKRVMAECLWLMKCLWLDGECEVCSALPGSARKEALPSPPLVGFLIFARRVSASAPERFLSPRRIMREFAAHHFGYKESRWKEAAAHISRTLTSHLASVDADSEKLAGYRNIIDSLPKRLLRHLHLSRHATEILCYDQYVELDADPVVKFRVEEFWSRLQNAFTRRDVVLKSEDGRQWKPRPVSNTGSDFASVLLICSSSNQKITVSHPCLSVLLPDKKAGMKQLLRVRSEFDLSIEEFTRLTTQIFSQKKARQRTDLLAEAWESSAIRHYDKLLALPQITAEQLRPPSFRALRRFLRLPAEGPIHDFSTALENAGKTLVREEGLFTAWQRFTLLPVRLPNCVMNGIDRLPKAEEEIWDEHFGELPLAWHQRLLWASCLAQRDGGSSDALEGTLSALVDEDGQRKAQGFFDLLRWSMHCLSIREDSAKQPASVVLACAWVHAGQIHRCLQLTNNEGGPLKEELEKVRQRPGPCSWFTLKREIEQDVSNPVKVDIALLLANGIGNLFSDSVWNRLSEKTKTGISQVIDANLHWTASDRAEGNLLGSFLHGRDFKPRVEGSAALLELLPTELEETLTKLRTDCMDKDSWSKIGSFLNHNQLVCRDRARTGVGELLQTHGLDKLLGLPSPEAEIFRYCLRVTLRSLEGGGERMRWVLPMVGDAASTYKSVGSSGDFWTSLAQCLLDAAFGDDTQGRVARIWSEACTALIEKHPDFAVWVRENLGVEFYRCTPEEQVDLIPLLLQARELP